MTDDPRDLLGGHATGSLSAEEKRRLYRTALDDQALFDALMDEEPLREVLEDPAAAARMRAVLAEEPPRGWLAVLSSGWMTAAAAALLVAAAIPLVGLLLERRSPREPSEYAVSRPAGGASEPVVVASAVDWAAAVERPLTSADRLAFRSGVSKEIGPLERDRRAQLRLVPDRSGRAMVVGIDAAGGAEKLYPPGAREWADVEADVPVDVPLPASAVRFIEYRLVVVERGADVSDLTARLDEGRAVVFRVRPN